MFQRIQQTLVCFSLLVAALGCSQAPSSGNQKSFSHSHNLPAANGGDVANGGIDGGGGGTLPADPIHQFQAIQIIQEAKIHLLPMVKWQIYMAGLSTRPNTLEKKLFLGQPNILDVLYSADMELLEDKPCKDSAGNEVDGSIYASRPNTICLSLHRIAPKLIKERARTEILALIMHELSHLLGATEDEAQKYQKDVAYNLANVPQGDERSYFINRVFEAAEPVSKELRSLRDGIESGESFEKLSKKFFSLNEVLSLWSRISTGESYYYQLMTLDEVEYYQYMSMKLLAADWFTTSMSGGPFSEPVKKKLDRIFQGNASVTYRVFLERSGLSGLDRRGKLDNELIFRITSRDELLALAKDFDFYFSMTEQVARNILFSSRPAALDSRYRKTPWSHFVGKYDVVSETCTDPEDRSGLIGIGIAESLHLAGEYRLFQYWPSGYGDQGGLNEGSYTPSSQTTFISGSADEAVRIAEHGDRWGDRTGHNFRQEELRLKKAGSGYQLTRRWTHIRWSSAKVKRSESTCVFELKKQ